MKINIGKTELIHFVGIGGIGMSGLALIMNELGFKVQGSDLLYNKNIERLKEKKINIFLNHKSSNIKKCTILVISSAIKKSNPELKQAIKLKLPIYTRGEMLGNIVSLDPTIINGGVLNSFGNSARLGKSNWCIIESDESDGSFLKIPFTYSIITNIDSEHLDFYKSLKNLKKNFSKLLNKTPSLGKSFICFDDLNNRDILKKINNKNFYTYGTSANCNFQITKILLRTKYSKFNLKINIPGTKKIIKNIKLPLLGFHNIRNAASAVAVSYSIGVSEKLIKKGLSKFKGVQRRFNYLFAYNDTIFFDDYAHHPTEIKSVLEGVKKVYKKKEIVCIFQPHRISRVKNLKAEFSNCFKKANTVLLCPIYKAGENLKLNFSYNSFAKLIIKNSKVNLIIIQNEKELSKYIKQSAYGGKIYIGMGAGTITNWVRNLKNILK